MNRAENRRSLFYTNICLSVILNVSKYITCRPEDKNSPVCHLMKHDSFHLHLQKTSTT